LKAERNTGFSASVSVRALNVVGVSLAFFSTMTAPAPKALAPVHAFPRGRSPYQSCRWGKCYSALAFGQLIEVSAKLVIAVAIIYLLTCALPDPLSNLKR
jgi:hypothetical protein